MSSWERLRTVPSHRSVPVAGLHLYGGPSRSIPFHWRTAACCQLLASARPVGAAHAGVHRLPQVIADEGVSLIDAGQRPADGLPYRHSGPLPLVGK
jgi:hypothetical protein